MWFVACYTQRKIEKTYAAAADSEIMAKTKDKLETDSNWKDNQNTRKSEFGKDICEANFETIKICWFIKMLNQMNWTRYEY